MRSQKYVTVYNTPKDIALNFALGVLHIYYDHWNVHVKNRYTLDLDYHGSENKIKHAQKIFRVLGFIIIYIFHLHYGHIRAAKYSPAIPDL
jgi:hypothetical protein